MEIRIFFFKFEMVPIKMRSAKEVRRRSCTMITFSVINDCVTPTAHMSASVEDLASTGTCDLLMNIDLIEVLQLLPL